MSTTQMIQPASIALSGAASLMRPVLRHVGHGVAAAWRAFSTRRDLLEMDERMLKDIGISKAQAHFEAKRWFR
jgi:uncharacterized protein YjiS (DUF1127 family)